MKFFIYSRKSVYTGKGESIENQIEMCKKYIQDKFDEKGIDEIVVYEDEGYSAKNTDRPMFKKMIKDIRVNKPDFIICYRLDRISRNVSDFAALIEDLNKKSISFICIKEEFDTSKPMGKAMMYIASVFSQLERETMAERIRDNMLMLARGGRWLGGTTPTGFTSEKISEIVMDGKIKTCFTLKEDEYEIEIIKIIFNKFLSCKTVSGVYDFLKLNNIKSRQNKFFSIVGLKQILENPVYCKADIDMYDYFVKNGADVCFEKKDLNEHNGIISYNKRDYSKKNVPRNSMDKWIISIGKHKGIICGRDWVEVQKILFKSKYLPIIHNDMAIFSGKLYCKKCGKILICKKRSYNGNIFFDYICSSKIYGGIDNCNCQNLNGVKTDDNIYKKIVEIVCQNIFDKYLLCQKLEELKKTYYKNNKIFSKEEKVSKLKIEASKLVKLISKYEEGSLFIDEIRNRINEIENELNILNMDNSVSCIQNNKIKDFSFDLYDKIINLSTKEKRDFIDKIVDKIYFDGFNIEVFLR